MVMKIVTDLSLKAGDGIVRLSNAVTKICNLKAYHLVILINLLVYDVFFSSGWPNSLPLISISYFPKAKNSLFKYSLSNVNECVWTMIYLVVNQ